MQNDRDSSVWRTLAVAFGDGLAFGVGVTLTRGAARLAANRAALAPPPAANHWKEEVAQRIAPPPAAAAAPAPLEAAIATMSRRVAETGGQIDRRLMDLEARIQAELDALDDQDHQLAEGVETRLDAMRGEIAAAVELQRQSIDSEIKTLRSQMTAVHKEFAETLARFMDEHIAKTVAARTQAMQEETMLQLSELREAMESQERNMRNLVQTLGENCLKAAAQETPVTAPEATPEAELPEFARTRPRKPLWRVPVVSSVVAATGGLMLLRWVA